jgi:hypothetical protein
VTMGVNGFTFDGATADPVQKVRDRLIAFVAATAQAEATRDAQRGGKIAHAKANDATAYPPSQAFVLRSTVRPGATAPGRPHHERHG